MGEMKFDNDADLQAKLISLHEEGQKIWNRFDADVRQESFHPFMPADYPMIQRALLPLRGEGLKFLEWGSATGVITIMADLLGFQAYGIEIDPELVIIARGLADKFGSNARFATGSFLPAGYEWRSPTGDPRMGTIEHGKPGYAELGHPLEDFDVVFGYPWSGEAPIMHDVMRRRGGAGARFLTFGREGPQVYTYPEPYAGESTPSAA